MNVGAGRIASCVGACLVLVILGSPSFYATGQSSEVGGSEAGAGPKITVLVRSPEVGQDVDILASLPAASVRMRLWRIYFDSDVKGSGELGSAPQIKEVRLKVLRAGTHTITLLVLDERSVIVTAESTDLETRSGYLTPILVQAGTLFVGAILAMLGFAVRSVFERSTHRRDRSQAGLGSVLCLVKQFQAMVDRRMKDFDLPEFATSPASSPWPDILSDEQVYELLQRLWWLREEWVASDGDGDKSRYLGELTEIETAVLQLMPRGVRVRKGSGDSGGVAGKRL